MTDRKTILRHIETSVDVDEWAVIGVKEEFEKLDKIEQIFKELRSMALRVKHNTGSIDALIDRIDNLLSESEKEEI
mgnify:FL=1